MSDGSQNHSCTASSDNTSVASVNATTGVITALTAGTVDFSAVSTLDSTQVSKAVTLTVAEPPPVISAVNVTADPATITTTQSSTCTAVVTGSYNFNPEVTWTATNGAVSGSGNSVKFTPSGAGPSSCTATSVADTTKSGSVGIASIAYSYVAPFGDSLTVSYQEHTGETYPAALIAQLPGKTLTGNWGIDAQRSGDIAVRMNAYAGDTNQAFGAGFTIPTSGSVEVTWGDTNHNPTRNLTRVSTSYPQGVLIQTTVSGLTYEMGCLNTLSSADMANCTPTNYPPSPVDVPSGNGWVSDLTGIVYPGSTLEIIWACENGRANPAQIYADYAAMTAAVRARGDSYIVVGVINSVADTCADCSQASINSKTNSTLAATYGADFFDPMTALIAAANPANPGDVYLAAQGAPPLSLTAVQIAGSLTTAIPDTTSCPTTWKASGPAVMSYGSVLTFTDGTGEQVFLNDEHMNNPPQSCIRGFNGTTAATHTNAAAFVATQGLHPSNISHPYNPALNAVPGYTLIANEVKALLSTGVN
jgi:hypothetical protein